MARKPKTKRNSQVESADTSLIPLSDPDAWRAALQTRRPVLAHLNADTTWLIQLPIPDGQSDASRSHFNILLDPWLQGPQSDVASWFSTQWHVVAPSVGTMAELNTTLASLEGFGHEEAAQHRFVDAVAISHEFTDHCHRATLEELSRETPVFATDEAAKLVRSWKHFDTVVTMPGLSSASGSWQEALAGPANVLPPWLGIGRVITAGNALYYHSAVVVAFDLGYSAGPAARTRSRRKSEPSGRGAEAVVYSPHGIHAPDLECVAGSGLSTVALLHGLHDVRIWMTAQLNLGALNGIKAARTSGAKYWVATHDEQKRGGGLVSWFLQRTVYTLRDAVEAEEAKSDDSEGYKFIELGSGDGMLLI